MRRLRLPIALAGLAALLACAGGARADVPYGVGITQKLFDASGDPRLIATTFPDGSLATPSWLTCPPGAAFQDCVPTGVAGTVHEPGPTAAGTTFAAVAEIPGDGRYADVSPPWLGRVAATAPPALAGAAKVGARVRSAAGTWAGGWGDERDRVQVQACTTADARGCVVIADPRAPQTPAGSVALDPRWSGRYLFAFDERLAGDTAEPAIGYLSPASVPRLRAGAAVARSAPLGPVRGPALALREHPLLLRDGRLLLGRVTCARRCRVAATLAPGGRGRTVVRAALGMRGTRRLTLDAGMLALHRPFTIVVRIGGAPSVAVDVPAGGVVAARAR